MAKHRARGGVGIMWPDAVVRAANGDGLRTFFQPIVSLPDRAVIGYEALSRWPGLGLPDATPVFERAQLLDRIDHLERACIDNAITSARETQIVPGALLSINSEAAAAHVSRHGDPVLDWGAKRYQVMFELTERDLLLSPAALLRKANGMRADGFAVAIDDLGVQGHSSALLDVIRPDVIKLDLQLVQRNPTVDQARTLAAVLAHRERSRAIILAEGIETDEHLEQAMALGADLGQGYLFGHPTAAPQSITTKMWELPVTASDTSYLAGTPFDLVKDSELVRVVRKQTLIAFSRSIERYARDAADTLIVSASIQHGRFFTGETRQNYLDLAALCPLVAVFGRGVSHDVGASIRFIEPIPGDALDQEWLVIALGGHSAAALMARDRRDSVATEEDRRFDFVVTHDRQVVARATRNLMSRIESCGKGDGESMFDIEATG